MSGPTADNIHRFTKSSKLQQCARQGEGTVLLLHEDGVDPIHMGSQDPAETQRGGADLDDRPTEGMTANNVTLLAKSFQEVFGSLAIVADVRELLSRLVRQLGKKRASVKEDHQGVRPSSIPLGRPPPSYPSTMLPQSWHPPSWCPFAFARSLHRALSGLAGDAGIFGGRHIVGAGVGKGGGWFGLGAGILRLLVGVANDRRQQSGGSQCHVSVVTVLAHPRMSRPKSGEPILPDAALLEAWLAVVVQDGSVAPEGVVSKGGFEALFPSPHGTPISAEEVMSHWWPRAAVELAGHHSVQAAAQNRGSKAVEVSNGQECRRQVKQAPHGVAPPASSTLPYSSAVPVGT
ncbi:hypothetical protein ABBQ38_010230 [Trebouxia sp. C0009 RCD-2024]